MRAARENGTCQMALLDALLEQIAECILNRPADNGVDGDPMVTEEDRVPAEGARGARNSARARRPRLRAREGTAISTSPRRPPSLPRCASAQAAARHPRPTRNRSGIPTAIHCAIPRTRRWASVSAPGQRNTTQAPGAKRDSGLAASRGGKGRFLRRWGDRWFANCDTEAHWWGWQISKTPGGLGRRYRDIRFDTLAEAP